jgi:hypothetical protein
VARCWPGATELEGGWRTQAMETRRGGPRATRRGEAAGPTVTADGRHDTVIVTVAVTEVAGHGLTVVHNLTLCRAWFELRLRSSGYLSGPVRPVTAIPECWRPWASGGPGWALSPVRCEGNGGGERHGARSETGPGPSPCPSTAHRTQAPTQPARWRVQGVRTSVHGFGSQGHGQ